MSVYDNDLPLGILREKDQETYRALRDWKEAGKPVEWYSQNGWRTDEPARQMNHSIAYRAVYEPPTAEEVERLRRKVAAGEKLADLTRRAWKVADAITEGICPPDAVCMDCQNHHLAAATIRDLIAALEDADTRKTFAEAVAAAIIELNEKQPRDD